MKVYLVKDILLCPTLSHLKFPFSLIRLNFIKSQLPTIQLTSRVTKQNYEQPEN